MKTLHESDGILEPELFDLCGELSATERVKAAQKFMRWADQLTDSAMLLDLALVPMVPSPKVPRGFLLVNYAKWQQDQLRALAHECGYNLSTVLRWALTKVQHELQEKIHVARKAGIAPRECWKLIEGNTRN